MKRSLSLHIAGLEFALAAEGDFSFTEDDGIYRHFVDCASPVSGPERIPVGLRIADPRPDPSWSELFESDETWQAFRDNTDTILVFRSPTEEGRFWWQCRLCLPENRVELIFAPELVDQQGDGHTISNPLHYPLDQLLTMMLLSQRQGCIFHAAGIGRSGRAIACIGRSGAGKTTVMGLLSVLEGTLRLSDDRLAIRLIDDGPLVFGTPWAGEGLVAANRKAKLQALVFLHQATEHRLETIDARTAAHQLLPTTSIPWFDEPRMTGCLETIDSLVGMVPAYNLHFRNDPGVADLIEEIFGRG